LHEVTAHILVVDDEPDLTALVRINLELAGFEVSVAHDGEQAVAAIHDRRPDLVLLDVMMPRLDGWGVLARLQETDTLGALPIVMLTALAGERDVIRAHLSGAVHYLTKPFDLRGLLDTIRSALGPTSDEQLRVRREQLRGFLQRLVELEAGRTATGPRVTFAGLESLPRPAAAQPPTAAAFDELTPRQQEVARLLAQGVEARAIAQQLGTSRSNVYAARTRIARQLGVAPSEVAARIRQLGIAVR
jgi:DNA-binding response OmpR family regulator